MRRNNRNMDNRKEGSYFKNILYLSGSILGIAVIAFVITFVLYGNKLNKEAKESKLSSQKIAELVPNTNETGATETTSEASSQVGKTVEESQREMNLVEENKQTSSNATTNTMSTTEKRTNTVVNKQTEQTNAKEEKKEEPKKEEAKKELEFIKPVEGQVLKSFAKDSLVYSDTLQEWVIHLGMDIKAEKTTVVKAMEEGTVKAIKNDPRYGLTVMIEHAEGFTSIYSNLFTTEFVTEGEKVKKGQSIGTVGNTATFEIAEESHLHVEILKDGENVDPSIYLK